MPKKNYENMLQKLKEESLNSYAKLEGQSRVADNNTTHFLLEGAQISLGAKLDRMDELDGTCEFSDLLHDLNRERE